MSDILKVRGSSSDPWGGIPAIVGPQGPAGPGVPTGGAAGQVLVKQSATDYDAAFENAWDVKSLDTNLTLYRQGNMRMIVAVGCAIANPVCTLDDGDKPAANIGLPGVSGTTASNRGICFFRAYSTGSVGFYTLSGSVLSSGEGWGTLIWSV